MTGPRKTYSEKLLDPRWQKKRLEILSRDKWTCQECGDKTRTLHVHHLYYKSGAEPWAYPNGSLSTLCDACHETISDDEPVEMALVGTLRHAGLNNSDLWNSGLAFAEFPKEISLLLLIEALAKDLRA